MTEENQDEKYALDNLRLQELSIIVESNREFFTKFTEFLATQGYASVFDFVQDSDAKRATETIRKYLNSSSGGFLYDGLGRPYNNGKAKWYFLAWLLRDAPAQRLEPLLSTISGSSLTERKVALLERVRKFVSPIFPDPSKWTWDVVSEVMLARLEGSRRALKGTRFEGIVRQQLNELFLKEKLQLTVGDKQVKLLDETYDVQISSSSGQILVPVKTRETMGGGHAMLFTRDIHKSIAVANAEGYKCIPIVIAESWGGDLTSLECEHVVYIQSNPNQLDKISRELSVRIEELLPLWKEFSGIKS